MPHLSIQYSGQLDQSYDMQALCDQLGKVMTETGIFPRAGVRVRAFPARYETVADRHPENAFVAMQAYVGAGRTLEDKQRAGNQIYAVAESFFADRLAGGHFLLSFEIFENDPALSWKRNTILPRLKAEAGAQTGFD
ncbi:MAG: 5-carboxymethyl-2-hydroxymuconate isomerase [Kiloniella sp.]|nr:5-carboxymethyl-2-hydroxymuconate isomerase [Kiloniella sp.]